MEKIKKMVITSRIARFKNIILASLQTLNEDGFLKHNEKLEIYDLLRKRLDENGTRRNNKIFR